MTTTLDLHYQFEIAHRTIGFKERDGNLHGHRIQLIATFSKDELDERQAVVDCYLVDDVIGGLIDKHEHKTILWQNDPLTQEDKLKDQVRVIPHNPTAEGLARYFYEKLIKEFPNTLTHISISINERIKATYSK